MPSGQDAFLVSVVGKTTAAAFGVADGVGGWIDQGIDSADFSHGLCNYMAQAAFNFPNDFKSAGKSLLQPLDLLQTGYKMVCSDRHIVGGGSTACIAVAEPDGTMSVAK